MLGVYVASSLLPASVIWFKMSSSPGVQEGEAIAFTRALLPARVGCSHGGANFRERCPNGPREHLSAVRSALWCSQVVTLVLKQRRPRLITSLIAGPEKGFVFLGMLSTSLFVRVVLKMSHYSFKCARR